VRAGLRRHVGRCGWSRWQRRYRRDPLHDHHDTRDDHHDARDDDHFVDDVDLHHVHVDYLNLDLDDIDDATALDDDVDDTAADDNHNLRRRGRWSRRCAGRRVGRLRRNDHHYARAVAAHNTRSKSLLSRRR
jgi:hypothetical protein